MKKRLFSTLMLAAVTLFVASCNNEPTPENPKNDPKIEIAVKDVAESSATFTLTATDAEQVYVYCSEAGAACDNATIKTEGICVDGTEVTVNDLTPATEYVAYALAQNGDKEAVANVKFATAAEPDQPFEGYELGKVISAVYRNDNDALAGNYEFHFGNTTNLGWEGDIQIFLDLYNAEDGDPLNPVLPNGEYLPGSDYAPFTYNPSNSYVDIVVEGGEVVSSPIMGVVTVERERNEYTITVEGTLMLLDDMEFSARYVGSIEFVQGGTSAYEFFEEDVEITMDYAQMRYWGGWFYPFADDLAIEMFQGTYDDDGRLNRGYYLHLSRVFMPKYADYNADNVPLAEGTYGIKSNIIPTYALPYIFENGRIEEIFGTKEFTGTYLQYIEGGQVKKIGLVSDGTFTVKNEGGAYSIVANFVADNGTKLTIDFSGELVSGNFNDNDESMLPRPWTTLDGDHTYTFPAETAGYAYCMGEIMKEGFDSWLLMIYAYNETYPNGYGDMFTTEFIVPNGDRSAVPTGEFTVGMDVEGYTMFSGTTDYSSNILFTYYGDLTPDEEGYSSETAPIKSGKVLVEAVGDGKYSFQFDLVDDGGNKITGEWSGVVYADDISEDMTSSASAAKPLRLAR